MEPDVNPFEVLAPALREAFEGASEAPERVDSSVAIKRMVEGPQQFTFLRDTNHSKYAIRRALREAIPAMVEAGAKHLFLEPAIYPKEHPLHSEDDVELADVMERLSSKPPRITSAEIRRQSYRFETVYVDKDLPEEEREEAQKQTGIEYAELLIEARNRGLTVHLAGDDMGSAEIFESFKTFQELKSCGNKREALARVVGDPVFQQSLSPEEKEQFDEMYNESLVRCNVLADENGQAYDRFLEARSGEWSEAQRAQRFVDMAGGEKAVVVFGFGHGLLGAALDSELRRRAYEDGQGEPAKTKVLDIWESRGAAASWEEKHPKTKYATPPDAVLYVKEGEMEMLPAPSDSPTSPVLAAAPRPPDSGR